jgi:hypothetical protein
MAAGQAPIVLPPVKASNTLPPAPVIGLAIVTALSFLVKLLLRARNSDEAMYGIESTSFSSQLQRGDSFSREMRNMNIMPMPQLSAEQVAAARARRQKERANQKLSLLDVELPPNHPWATKTQVSAQEEEEVRARLRVRQRLRPAASPAEAAGQPSTRHRELVDLSSIPSVP